MLAIGMAGVADREAGAAEIEAGAILISPEISTVSTVIRQYEIVEPEFVSTLTPFESGRNDSNPVWDHTGKVLEIGRAHV